MSKKIGFIGVGMMGHGMAKNLLEKGFPVTTMAHRNRAPLEDLVDRGATEAATPRAVAEAADVVIICVTGAPQVEAIVFGEQGVLAAAHDGMIVIDCSTSEPYMTAKVAEALAAKGARMADAPLARTPIEAEQGRLNTMVGADEAVFGEIRPVLEAFCENIFHLGGLGSGHTCKLVNNFLALGQAALIAEALTTCAAAGVDMNRFYEVISAGGANSGIFQLMVPPALKEGDYSGLKFSLANAAKDLGYYARLADTAGLSNQLGASVHQAMVKGLNLGFQEGFVGDLIRAQAKLNGIKVIDD